MKEQIEQLKADKAALELAQLVMRKHGGYVSELVIETGIRIQDQIKELERQADDPWKEAKELIAFWEVQSDNFPSYYVRQRDAAKYVRHLEGKVKELESTVTSNAEPLCPRRVVATAAVVMQQSMSFLIETNQMKQFPHEHAQRHADTIHLLKQSAGTEAKPYKTIAVKDLEL